MAVSASNSSRPGATTSRPGARKAHRGSSSHNGAPGRSERPRSQGSSWEPAARSTREERRAHLQPGAQNASRDRSERPRWTPAERKLAEKARAAGKPASRGKREFDRPGDDRPTNNRASWQDSDRPRSEAPRSDRPRTDRPRTDRPRTDRPRTDRPRDDRPRTDRPSWQNSDRPRTDRPRDDRPSWQDSDRPGRRDDRPRTDRPRTDRPRDDRPRDDRPRTDRPRDDRPRSDRPRWQGSDRPARHEHGSRPRQDRAGRPSGRDRVERAPRVAELTGPNAFVDLGVPSNIAAVLASQQITEPTPIQELAIPEAIAGRDVLGRGKTGSGKTLAFGLPLLTRLAGARGNVREPRALILAPTRELAMQVQDALAPLAATVGLRTQLVIGGSPYDRQIRGLERADVVVATPGRLVDLSQRGSVSLASVSTVVLDEADHMADLGFMPEIEAIMDQLDNNCQASLFSATLDADVDRLVRKYLHDPVIHSVDPTTASIGTMEHHIVLVHPKDKDAVTIDIAQRRGRTVAFVRTQMGADRLAGQLEAQGVNAAALHGGMKQGMRTRTMNDFKEGRIDVLVATDVAARGIHVDAIDLVVHVDPPHGPKEYLHRSGRTARAGASGKVISIATHKQQRMVTAITSKAGVNAEILRTRPGDEALRDLVAP